MTKTMRVPPGWSHPFTSLRRQALRPATSAARALQTLHALHVAVAFVFVVGACLALRAPCAVLAADLPPDVPSITLGSGRSEIVEYDSALRPVRRYTGLESPMDITPTTEETFLFVDPGTKRVTEVTRDGTVRWSENIGGHPMRIRTRPGGGFLVTAFGKVIALRPDRSVDFELAIANVSAAVPLANGNVVVAYNDGQGWLAEMTPSGEVIRRTAARGGVDHSGQWIDEPFENYFISVSSVDIAGDGAILAANFDAGDVRVLTSDLRFVRAIPGFGHAADTRFGPNGEIVVVTPEQWRVWLLDSDGHRRWVEPPMIPRCASLTPWGTLLVGMWWTPEEEVLNATALLAKPTETAPWWRRPLPLPILALFFSVLVAWGVRRRAMASSALWRTRLR